MFRFLRYLLQPQGQASTSPPRRFKRRRGDHRKTPTGFGQSHAPRRKHQRRGSHEATNRGRSKRPGWWPFSQSTAASPRTQLKKGEVLTWHGTPNLANAKSIVAHGWVVGNGNAHGDGIYTTSDFNVAKGYAGSSGYVLKLAVRHGRVATWSTSLQSGFNTWCTKQGCAADMSAKTAFLLNQGFNTLREGNVIVVLLRGYRNPLAAKIRTRRVRVVSAVGTADGKEIDARSLH